ncbi:hypothetical protein [Chitiniphilus eburneus]|uniref:Uncharacterized protein n=1 Tax=Chitiniphilus eburneus TaxID=2571148 RepID=A0A4U0PX86_9NEIS|nr:hypothetical protein [Chitiniphilus eburneus]TJZ73196.1 hypothetical protein FAZ21_11300 [Chitiniphilus eburneus]
MPNLYTEFKKLIPDAPLLVGDVITVVDGGVLVRLPGGAEIRARGEAAMGDRVFVRDGAVEGKAPTLPVVEIRV